MGRAIWTVEHINYLANLDIHSLSYLELSTLMSKQFKMRITPGQVGAMFTKMRTPGHEFYRDVPYRSSGAKRQQQG